MIAIAIAALALAAVSMGAAITFALMNSKARDERETARVDFANTNATCLSLRVLVDNLRNDLKSEQERADALDDELLQTHLAADPVGARERVLSRWQTDHAASRGRTVALSTPAAAAKPGSDDLLKPGD